MMLSPLVLNSNGMIYFNKGLCDDDILIYLTENL